MRADRRRPAIFDGCTAPSSWAPTSSGIRGVEAQHLARTFRYVVPDEEQIFVASKEELAAH